MEENNPEKAGCKEDGRYVLSSGVGWAGENPVHYPTPKCRGELRKLVYGLTGVFLTFILITISNIDQYVIPGNIIYKQRGTIWHAGENALAGRDHTIHAAVTGYVKYYRDPARHPTRQYIGVAFNRNDTLPYPQNAVRRRKLGLVAQQRKPEPKESATVSPSGIPLWVTRRGDAFAGPESQGEGGSGAPKNKKAWVRAQRQKFERARKEKRDTQTLHLRSDYSYREHNWEIGRLVSDIGKVPGTGKIGSRKSIFRARRRRRNAEFVRLKGLNKARRERRIAHEKVVAEKRAVRAAEAAQEAEKARKRKLQENEESKENNKA